MSAQTPAPQWLQGLPLEEPPAHLWSRILETRVGIERQRRRRLGWAAGLANAALLVLLAATWLGGARSPAKPEEALQTLIARSQALEERLLAYEARFADLEVAQRLLAEQHHAQLTALDRSLAEAYADGRPVSDLNALWRRRAGLVSALLSLYEVPQAPLEET